MNLSDYKPTPLSELLTRFDRAKYDSSYLVKTSIETIEEITQGKAVLVDATTPAVMLLEMSASQAAVCVLENLALLRRQYPVLAVTEDELYHHMSDEDYLNRFALPAEAEFIFMLQVQDILREAVYDSSVQAYRLTLPRETTIVVDGVSFMTLYPVSILRYDNGALQVSYDTDQLSPLMPLNNTIIDYAVRKGTEQEDWLFFSLKAKQLAIQTSYHVIDRTYSFKKTIAISDDFHHATIYYQNNTTNGAWVELATTHTDQVFDIETPTAVLQVRENEVDIRLPVIYTTTGQLSGQLRVDLYTTKGKMSMNLQNYRPDTFSVTLRAVDETRDLNAATRAMGGVSFYVYSQTLVEGGRAPLDFESLRQRVISNTVGPQVLPITSAQIATELENNGFDLFKNIDVLTNRVFLATRSLPTPSNRRLVTAANIGIVTYAGTLDQLIQHPNVVNNGDRITIRSKTLWQNQNGSLSLLDPTEQQQLYAMTQTAMVAQINSRQYVYTPFYYVLDATQDEFSLRAYSLDQPKAKNLNFVRQNQTLQLFVNTASYQLTKTLSGYALRIQTKSGNFYKSVGNNEVGVQLGFYPHGENTLVYLQGALERTLEDGERVFRFDLMTSHDIDQDDLLCITNARVQGVESYNAWINLESTFHLLHYTTSLSTGFLPDLTDQLIGKFLLPAGAVGNSHEQLTLTLGYALSNLWTRSRSYKLDTVYRRHLVDVPQLWETTVYDPDPATGAIFDIVDGELQYRILHEAGTPVIENGQPVYKYRAGDVLLDEQGLPVEDRNVTLGREVDLVMVDGRYYFANDSATVAYRDEIEATLVDWITDEIQDFQDRLLEKTRIYFYPKTTLGLVQVYTENNGVDHVTAEQTFRVNLYVPQDVYRDTEIRERLSALTIQVLDEHISKTTINLNDIVDQLKTLYGRSVRAFNVSGLGGSRNYQMLNIASERNKLCLKKELVIQPDKSLIVKDAVNIEFLMVN